jgi:uncharacterized protein YlzI (FlbEa/FlbD family)
MKFIELTLTNGSKIMLNPLSIEQVQFIPSTGKSQVVLTSRSANGQAQVLSPTASYSDLCQTISEALQGR